MYQIYIAESNRFQKDHNIFFISFSEADKVLQILRSQYFGKITIQLPQDINDKQLRFMMQLSRILKQKGQVDLQNVKESIQTQKFTNLAKKLGLFICQNTQKGYFFTKTKPQQTKKLQYTTNQKLSIGFQPFIQQQIDQDDLLKNQNISLTKIKAQSCAQKPRACANCNCGRKDGQQPTVSKQKLIDSINEGKPVSGCGKCFLGDSFRCGTCPYKGLPAFKPGDKLKMMDQGQVLVQTGEVKVSAGKVKIQL